MEEQEDRRGRALGALQVAAVSGFAEHVREMQRSCLDLCHACRDGVPMPLLRVSSGMPSGLRGMFCSGVHQAEADPVSRVLPHRRVLSVEWTFRQRGSDIKGGGAEQQEGEGWDAGAKLDIYDVKWPEGTRSILLDGFHRAVQGVVWPASLERLVFGRENIDFLSCWRVARDVSDHSLDGVHFPSGLREIFLDEAFDQPIDNVAWPEGLEKLSLPRFNRPIDNVRWPAGLKVLEFMPCWQVTRIVEMTSTFSAELQRSPSLSFNQPINAGLPAGLHTLWLSNDFDQPIDNVVWPTGLVTIGFGRQFNRSLRGVAWPSTLRRVFSVYQLSGYGDGELPPGCKVFVAFKPDSDADEYGSEQDFESMADVDEWHMEHDADYVSDTIRDWRHDQDDDSDNYSDFSM